MYSVLQAERALEMATATAVGTGAAEDPKKIMRAWRQAARTPGEERRDRSRHRDPKAVLASIAAMGIPVIVEGEETTDVGEAGRRDPRPLD